MKKPLPLLLLLVLLPLLLSVTACVLIPEEDWPVVMVTGDITTATTWTAGTVYVVAATDIWVTSVLTIEAGTIVKFDPAVLSPMLTLGGGGLIYADGTASSPIVFTSYYDDTRGGDSNDDGGATSPAPQDWDHVDTNGEGSTLLDHSIFDYCEFYYGGGGTYTDTLAISSLSDFVEVTNCTFVHNDGGEASGWYGVLDASGAGPHVLIQNNVFYDNVQPLAISDYLSLDDTNVFHNPNNAAQTNERNGIFVYTTTLTTAISWGETEVAFIIADTDYRINGGTLNLADNVVVKFRTDSHIVLLSGGAIGNYGGSGVYFTSYYDDAVASKGDTNGDGSATSPSELDWVGILDDDTPQWMLWGNILYSQHP